MQTWEQAYELESGGQIEIRQHSGPVLIKGGEPGRVRLVASSEGATPLAERLEIEADSHRISVEVRPERAGFFTFGTRSGASLRLELTVPAGTACSVESGSGPVEISGVGGWISIETGSGGVKVYHAAELKVESGSGPILVEGVNGDASIETGSGGVVARRISGDLNAETGSGQVVVEDLLGSAEIETGNGGAVIRRVRGDQLKISSGSGRVLLEQIDVRELESDTGSGGVTAELIRIAPGGNYWVESGSGSVQIAVPPDADLTIDATGSGRIDYRGLPLTRVRQEKGELEGVLGRGGPRLSVEAGSGAIVLAAAPLRQSSPRQVVVVKAAGAECGEPGMKISSTVLANIQSDGALESSEQIRRVLKMVEEGKLTPAEAEEILSALNEEVGSA